MKKFTLSDKASILIIQRIIERALQFLTMILFVRLFSQEIYGSLRQLGLLQNFLVPIATLSIPSSLMFFIPAITDLNKRKLIASQTLYFLIGSAFFIVILLLLASNLISNAFHNPNLKSLIYLYSLSIFFMIVNSYFAQAMYAFEKITLSAIFMLLFKIMLLIVVLFTFLSKLSINTYLILMGITLGFEFIIILFLTWRVLGGLKLSIDKELLMKQIHYALPLSVSNIVSRLGRNVDLLMISFYFNPAVYAIYSIGATEFPLNKYIRQSVANVSIPKYVQFVKDNKINHMISLFHEAIRKSLIIIIPFFTYLLFTSYHLVIILFSKNYIESVNIFRVYLLILPLGCISYGSILRAVGNTKSILRISIIYVITNIILNFIFLKFFGLIGPAIATVLSTICIQFLYIRQIAISVKKSFFNIFPFKLLFKITVFSFFSFFPVLIVTYQIKSHIFVLFISALLFFPICIFLYKKFCILTPEDISYIKKRFNFKLGFLNA